MAKRSIGAAKTAARIWTVLLLSVTSLGSTFAQDALARSSVVLEMIEIVTMANAELQSQVDRAAAIASVGQPEPDVGLTGITLSSSGSWAQAEDPANDQTFSATGSVGFSFALRDSSWPARQAAFIQSRADAEQRVEAIRSEIIGELFDALQQLASTYSELERIQRSRALIGRRLELVNTGAVAAGIEQLWALEDSLLQLDVDLATRSAALEQLEMRIALQQGGNRWEDLLLLLQEWAASDRSGST